MDNNLCREVFKDRSTITYCEAVPMQLHVGTTLRETGNQVVECKKLTVSIKAEFIPSKRLGIFTLHWPELFSDTPEYVRVLVQRGFKHESVVSNLADEAKAIRHAITLFDDLVETLNRLSPFDETEAGDVLPSTPKEQAA